MKQKPLLAEADKPKFRQKKSKLYLLAAILILVAGFFVLAGLSQSSKNGKKAGIVIPAYWLSEYFHTNDVNNAAVGGSNGDPDHDGLTNYQEYIFHTHPLIADTDDDGVSDGKEVAAGTDPLAGISYNPLKAGTKDIAAADPNTYRIYDNLVSDGLLDPKEVDATFNLNRPFVVPTIPDSKLKIIVSNVQTNDAYQKAIAGIISNKEAGQLSTSFSLIFTTESTHEISALKSTLDRIINTLYSMPVPRDMVAAHKNQIIFFEAMKNCVLAREKILLYPNQLSQWGEIIYQTRIMASVSGSDNDLIGDASQ